MTITVSLTLVADKDNAQGRLRALVDAFVQAVPEADRVHSNVSLHDPADVVVCLQQAADGRVSVWHVDTAGPLAAAQAEVARLRYQVHQLERQAEGARGE